MSISNSTPLVSTVITVYNGAAFLRESIESALSQTYAHHEVIVVNDGSTDESSSISREYSEVRLIIQENQGEGGARNRGISESRGDLIAYLDSDDRWTEDKIEKQVDLLASDPTLDFVLCRVLPFYEEGSQDHPWAADQEKIETHGAYYPSALLARKSLFDSLGRFRTDVRMAPDIDWFLRASDANCRYEILEEPLLHRRLHDENSTSSQSELRKIALMSVRESIRRKKLNSAQS